MSLPDYLKPPDFELRCDNFVNAVIVEIEPRHPELAIDAENITKSVLNNPPGLTPRMDRIYEIGSSFAYRAIVTIWGWEGPQQASEIRRAAEEIRELAKKFDAIDDTIGTYQTSGTNPDDSLNDPNLPSYTLFFEFRDS